jgi:hypothetical protein
MEEIQSKEDLSEYINHYVSNDSWSGYNKIIGFDNKSPIYEKKIYERLSGTNHVEVFKTFLTVLLK